MRLHRSVRGTGRWRRPGAYADRRSKWLRSAGDRRIGDGAQDEHRYRQVLATAGTIRRPFLSDVRAGRLSVAFSPSYVWDNSQAVVRARWYLRHADQVGTRVRLRGHPAVTN